MKDRIEDLAVLGGPRVFAQPLHVGRPNIGDRDRLLARIGEMLDRRWLTNHGPLVQELEARIARLVGVQHCVAVCNATVGLEVASRALGMEGEVIVPSFTFVATAHALRWQAITPVFCDIDARTHNLDPARIEALITPRTTGIVGVHCWGRPCEVEAIEAIARRHGLRLIFDAAHAFGCSRRGRMVGSFGDAEVFSFHATKFVNCFEGGAIVTNDDDLARRIRLMTNFGFAGTDKVIYLGTNGKMNEACAAMGVTSLDAMAETIGVNRRNYESYAQGLAGLPGITLLPYDERERHNFQYVVLEVEADPAGLDRDRLVEVLQAEGVLARRYFFPACHRMEPYCSEVPEGGWQLPVTERLTGRVMSLPTGTAVGPGEIGQVCEIVRFAATNGREIARRLAESGRLVPPSQ